MSGYDMARLPGFRRRTLQRSLIRHQPRHGWRVPEAVGWDRARAKLPNLVNTVLFRICSSFRCRFPDPTRLAVCRFSPAPAGLAGTRLRRKGFQQHHLRFGYTPAGLSGRWTSLVSEVAITGPLQDPCQLAWQVNESFERNDVCGVSSGIASSPPSLTKLLHRPDKLAGVEQRWGRPSSR